MDGGARLGDLLELSVLDPGQDRGGRNDGAAVPGRLDEAEGAHHGLRLVEDTLLARKDGPGLRAKNVRPGERLPLLMEGLAALGVPIPQELDEVTVQHGRSTGCVLLSAEVRQSRPRENLVDGVLRRAG